MINFESVLEYNVAPLIASFLDDSSISSLCQVSKKTRGAFISDDVWKLRTFDKLHFLFEKPSDPNLFIEYLRDSGYGEGKTIVIPSEIGFGSTNKKRKRSITWRDVYSFGKQCHIYAIDSALVIGHMKSKRKSFLGEFEEIPNFEPLVEKIMKIKPDCPDGDSKIIERTLNGKRMLFVRVIFSAKRKVHPIDLAKKVWSAENRTELGDKNDEFVPINDKFYISVFGESGMLPTHLVGTSDLNEAEFSFYEAYLQLSLFILASLTPEYQTRIKNEFAPIFYRENPWDEEPDELDFYRVAYDTFY